MTLPNFLILGAAKCGTTALQRQLLQHPDIYMSPVKEPKFFALEGRAVDFRGPGDIELTHRGATNSLDQYCRLFDGVAGERAVGEASVQYLYSAEAPQRIARHIPDAKLICVLRHPAERAYSNFVHMRRDHREPLDDFGAALNAEEERIRDNWAFIWHYKQLGFYSGQLKRYFELFDRERIKIYLYEDYTADPSGTVRDIFQFLGVDASFSPDLSRRANASLVPRSKLLQKFIENPHPFKNILKPFIPMRFRRRIRSRVDGLNFHKPAMSPALRRELIGLYREDVLRLQEMIGRDLSHWLR